MGNITGQNGHQLNYYSRYKETTLNCIKITKNKVVMKFVIEAAITTNFSIKRNNHLFLTN